MIKLICLDLDGVLLDLCSVHYEALNRALVEVAGERYKIDFYSHENKYNGLPTRVKLKMLTEEKGLSVNKYSEINKLKQKYTMTEIEKQISTNFDLINVLESIDVKYQICCVTNSIRDTVAKALLNAGIAKYFDYIISNEDVLRPKPNGDPYLQACIKCGVSPYEVLCFEDSLPGFQSVVAAGCNLWRVSNPRDLTEEQIKLALKVYERYNDSDSRKP